MREHISSTVSSLTFNSFPTRRDYCNLNGKSQDYADGNDKMDNHFQGVGGILKLRAPSRQGPLKRKTSSIVITAWEVSFLLCRMKVVVFFLDNQASIFKKAQAPGSYRWILSSFFCSYSHYLSHLKGLRLLLLCTMYVTLTKFFAFYERL